MSNMQFYRRIFLLTLVGLGYLFITLQWTRVQPTNCPEQSVNPRFERHLGPVPPDEENDGLGRRFTDKADLEHVKNSEHLKKNPPLARHMGPGGVQPEIIAPPNPAHENVVDEPEPQIRHPQKPPKHVYDVDKLPHDVLLQPGFAPNTVFYVWCGRRWFEFHHYLSVISVIKELRPDNLVFFYDNYPVQDYWLYNTWFQEIIDEYPFFRHQQLLATDNACSTHSTPNMTFIQNVLTFSGGMYINEHTILSDYPINLRSLSIVNGLENNTSPKGFLQTHRGFPGNKRLSKLMSDPTIASKQISCSSIPEYATARKKPICVLSKATFFPKDIWELRNDFGRLARRLFYGTPEITLPQRNYDDLIPNIAHVVWIGGGEMDYLFYLCVLSLIYVAEVDKVYIHGDAPPSGPLWMKIKDNAKVRLIYRETPKDVYGTRVEVLSHVTDVWRVDFMLRYGGIYVDTDTIWVRALDRDIRAYDAVGSVDWTYWNPPFPDTINFGVAIGKRKAKYWQLFQESMKWFIDKDWSWNGLRQPYRIKERNPELMLIDPHLQVICYEFKCHPTWWPNYHNESIHHLNSHSIKDWKNDVYAFHFTLPTPPELISEEALLKADSMFGEIGRYVLHRAGLLNLNH